MPPQQNLCVIGTLKTRQVAERSYPYGHDEWRFSTVELFACAYSAQLTVNKGTTPVGADDDLRAREPTGDAHS